MPSASGLIPGVGLSRAKGVRSPPSGPVSSFEVHKGVVLLGLGRRRVSGASRRFIDPCRRVAAMSSSTPASGSTDLFRGAMPKTEIGALEFLKVVSAAGRKDSSADMRASPHSSVLVGKPNI